MGLGYTPGKRMARMIRTLVTGYGYWGSVMARNLIAHPGFFLAAIHDPDPDRLNAAAGHNIHAYKYLDEAIDKTHPELVCVCTPINAIAETSCRLLTRHTNVMSCKPGAIDTNQYERILNTARKYHRSYIIDYTTLAAPSFAELQQRLTGQRIERIIATRYAETQRSSDNIIDDLVVHDVAMITQLVTIDEPCFTKAQQTITRADFAFTTAGTEVIIRADRYAHRTERTLHIETPDGVITYDQTLPERYTPVESSLSNLYNILRGDGDTRANEIVASHVLNLTDRMKLEAA
jgi:predicted dehydrogenase